MNDTTHKTIQPVSDREIFDGNAKVTIFGRDMPDMDLSVDPRRFLDQDIFSRHEVDLACMPNLRTSEFALCTPDQFSETHTAETDANEVISLRYGKECQGIILSRDVSAFMRTADCPTLTVWNGNGQLAVLHCGRDQLIDPARVAGGDSRDYPSIIDLLMNTRVFRGVPKADIRAFISCGIHAYAFNHPVDHPEHGERNKDLIAHIQVWGIWEEEPIITDWHEGTIDLFELIKAQLRSWDVPFKNIDSDKKALDTYADPQLFSHRRDGSNQRNLIAVRF